MKTNPLRPSDTSPESAGRNSPKSDSKYKLVNLNLHVVFGGGRRGVGRGCAGRGVIHGGIHVGCAEYHPCRELLFVILD